MSESLGSRDRLWVWGVTLTVFLVALLNVTPHVIGVFFDDGIYALQAKAIAEGQGFVYPQLPGTPPAIHYPPLYPLVLAMVWKVAPAFPESVMWLKLVNPLLTAVAAFAAMPLARTLLRCSTPVAAVVVLLGFVSIPVMLLTSVLMSEPLFLALLFPALLMATRAVTEGDRRFVVLAAVLAAAVVLTRTLGGVIVPATMLALAWDRRWRDVAWYGVTVIVLLLPWQYFVWRHAPGFPDVLRGSYGPYLEWLVDGYRAGGWPLARAVLRENVRDAWGFLGIFFSPLVRSLRPLAVIGLVTATLAGALLGLREARLRIVALSTGAYLAVVFAWPYQVERFLWGAWPFLVLAAAVGFAESMRLLSGVRRLAGGVLLGGLLLSLGHATYNVRALVRGWAVSGSRVRHEQMLPVVQFGLRNSDLKGRVIGSDAAPALALYTGAQVISLDILRVDDYAGTKPLADYADAIAALDSTFSPDLFIVMPSSPQALVLERAAQASPPRYREATPPGSDVRVFLPLSR